MHSWNFHGPIVGPKNFLIIYEHKPQKLWIVWFLLLFGATCWFDFCDLFSLSKKINQIEIDLLTFYRRQAHHWINIESATSFIKSLLLKKKSLTVHCLFSLYYIDANMSIWMMLKLWHLPAYRCTTMSTCFQHFLRIIICNVQYACKHLRAFRSGRNELHSTIFSFSRFSSNSPVNAPQPKSDWNLLLYTYKPRYEH